ncbi:MAG TPA: choice-of-anchor Q domain-containing protein, partial [Candidatus Acidoferrales bacterium]|nr:choice-of-anchor Q domain-containing protein [Candidatus Acidoferrales bacterium]
MNRAQSYTINSVFVLAMVALALLAPPVAHAQATITVNSTLQVVNPGPGGPGVGGNADSLCQLSEAIRAANTDLAVDGCGAGSVAGPDTINVPAGTYTLTAVDIIEPGTGLPFGLPIITSNVIITGAGAATTIIERSTAGGTPTFAFLILSGAGANLTLNDLTFRNGNQAGIGGAIASRNSAAAALTVNNCVFDSNTAQNGGAVAQSATINNSTFINNTASVAGGAIWLGGCNCDLTITNSTFSSNNASQQGGAIYAANLGDSISISHSVFTNNSATDGGALFISDRSSQSFFGNGPALIFVTIDSSLFSGNQSGSGGAISTGPFLFFLGLSNSTFVNNQATSIAGALLSDITGNMTISNSTFSGNTAGTNGGGAMRIQTQNSVNFTLGQAFLNNVTIVNNSTSNAGNGGGIRFGSGALTYSNTIIAGNSPSDTSGAGSSSTEVTSLGFNLIGDNTSSGSGFPTIASDQAGTGANPINPLVGGPANNGSTVMAGSNVGGQTPQVVPTVALLTGSPALEKGNPGTPLDGTNGRCAATDQRSIARPQPAGGTCDVGALEDLTGLGVAPQADFSVTKTGAPGTVSVGQNITFTITVTNNGPDPAAGSFTDNLPASFQFVSLTSPAGWTCTTPVVGASGTVSCSNTGLSSGASGAFTLVVTTTSGGTIGNTASVSVTGSDAVPANDSATATTTVTALNADMSVTKSAPASITLGSGNITYTVVVTNNGPADATNVVLSDTLPAGATFVSATPTGPVCTVSGGIVTCNLGGMVNGGSATITIVVTPTAAATLTNTASVTATEPDPTSGNNSATASTTVNPSADLSVTKTDSPDPVNAGANLTYTVTVSNAGPSAAPATLTDTLPAGVTFVSATPSNAPTGTCSQAAG